VNVIQYSYIVTVVENNDERSLSAGELEQLVTMNLPDGIDADVYVEASG